MDNHFYQKMVVYGGLSFPKGKIILGYHGSYTIDD